MKTTKLFVIVFQLVFVSTALLSLTLVDSHTIRGVSPQDSVHYQGTTFRCLDGKGDPFPVHVINDDFCDCIDGSDEPGTSACNNGLFYCKNSGHLPNTIFSSRVNDGICDCCDGSDEYLTSTCENVCKEAWAQSTSIIRAEVQEHQLGIDFTTKMQQKYEVDIRQKQQELTLKEEKKQSLHPRLEELKSKKEMIQSLLETKTKELRESLLTHIEPEVEQRYEQKQLEELQQQQQQQQEQEQQNVDNTQETEGEEPPIEVYNENHEPQSQTGVEAGNTEETEITPESEEEKQKRIQEEKEIIRNEILDQKVEGDEQIIFIKGEITKLDEEVNSLNQEILDLDGEIGELKRFIEFDFGDQGRYSYMEGASYSYNTPDYTYTLKPFKEVTQGHTRVGSWNSWANDYGTMKYENGERCWNGPDRSITISLNCGSETQILDVKEPSKCVYDMQIKTPAACSTQRLEMLLAILSGNY